MFGEVPSTMVIQDRFLHQAEIIATTSRSYRLKDRAENGSSKKEKSQKNKDKDHSGQKKHKPG